MQPNRWNKQKGSVVGDRYSQWNTNEPDLEDFDYDTRLRSPLTHLAFDECSENPTFGCSTGEYSCANLLTTTSTLGSQVKLTCSTTSSNVRTGRCRVRRNTIFADIRQIFESTGESKPACLALLGPDIDSTLQTQNSACNVVDANGTCAQEYNPCQVMFNLVENSDQNSGFSRWVDVNCARKTLSVMCEIIGIYRSCTMIN